MTSIAWLESSYSKAPIAFEVADVLFNNSFWKNVEHIVNVTESLVMVLCLVDSEDKPSMGYIYEATEKAKEAIQKKRLENKKKYSLLENH